MRYTTDGTLASSVCRGVWLSACWPHPPSEPDWMTMLEALVLERGASDRALVWSAGGAPTMFQILSLATIPLDSQSGEMPMAACVDSPLARLSLGRMAVRVGYDLRVFPEAGEIGACAALGIGPQEVPDVLLELSELKGLLV